MQTQTILISGCSRGIGLALTKHLISKGHTIVATCRDPQGATELKAVADSCKTNSTQDGSKGRVIVYPLDVGSSESIAAARASMERDGIDTIDCLICNAGVTVHGDPPQTCDRAAMLHVFDVNVCGVLDCIQTFTPLLRRSSRRLVVVISSRAGSLSMHRRGSITSYRCSKAAANMLVKNFALEESKNDTDGITFISVHPGTADTEMGRAGGAPLEPLLPVDESAAGIAKIVEEAGREDNGRFLQWDGQELTY
ncbi:unnamed protein product [Vitrella brassicaformis CCMP3155]|uniref:Uncharacterized protein n=2 Tax=Vitrella brassicaformis TaxID=1169539 RepID=A0A0G4EKQ4_VITBC|nr:unnamed protein product [Vitrella brassicaformis CCMP3155]|eukprot:CEL97024.1 unnamed protein product [Vitrella brassicaformis CCMP3155]